MKRIRLATPWHSAAWVEIEVPQTPTEQDINEALKRGGVYLDASLKPINVKK